MALPTTNLTLHVDPSDNTKNFTVFDSVAGVHTINPTDGQAVLVCDDQGDGIADIILRYNNVSTESPLYRVTTPLMRRACLDFDGTDDYYRALNQTGGTNKTFAQLFSDSAFTILIALYPEAISANAADSYNNHGVISDSSGWFGLYLKDVAGVKKCYIYNDGGGDKAVSVDINLNENVVIMARHEGGNLYISKNGGAESSIASANTSGSAAGSAIIVGNGYSGVKYNGRIGEIAIWNAALTGTALTDAIAWFTSRWAVISNNATGALASAASAASGAGKRNEKATGTPLSQASSVSGAAKRNQKATGTVTAQAAVVAGASVRNEKATGSILAPVSSVAGSAKRNEKATGVLTAQVSTIVGNSARQLKILLTTAQGQELRDQSGALVTISGVIWQWYDAANSTAGTPVDSGTVNIVAGEATLQLQNSIGAAGDFGTLVMFHPSNPAIRAIYSLQIN